MATAAFAIQTITAQINAVSPNSIRINTFDTSGNPVDVHTGYTIYEARLFPASDMNSDCLAFDLTSQSSAAFDTTGVTLNMTKAQTAAIYAALPVNTNTLVVALSNDSGTTSSLVATGITILNAYGGQL
jgi:hypothetical protein